MSHFDDMVDDDSVSGEPKLLSPSFDGSGKSGMSTVSCAILLRGDCTVIRLSNGTFPSSVGHFGFS